MDSWQNLNQYQFRKLKHLSVQEKQPICWNYSTLVPSKANITKYEVIANQEMKISINYILENKFYSKGIQDEIITNIEKIKVGKSMKQNQNQKRRYFINKIKNFQNQIINQNKLKNKLGLMDSSSKDKIIPDYPCCYRYPIKFQYSPYWIALAYEGTILIYNGQKKQLRHYDIEGNILSYIILPQSPCVFALINKQQQIHILLKQINDKQNYCTCSLLKWNFKDQKKQLIKIDYKEKEIRNDITLLFCFDDDVYCMMILEVKDLKFIHKIKVNYFKEQNLQKPFISLLVNVENDEFFKKFSIYQFHIMKDIKSQHPIITIFKSKISENQILQSKFLILEQEKKVCFYTFKTPPLQLKQTKIQNIQAIYFDIQNQNFGIDVYFSLFRLTYNYKKVNNQLIYENHNAKKFKDNDANTYATKQFLLQFKNSPSKYQKIKAVRVSPYNINTKKQQNIYHTMVCHHPKSMAQLFGKAFFGRDQIIISIQSNYLQYKKRIVFFLESIIYDCNENLVFQVIELLFEEKIWRQ